jgi:soluble cytochrome b562
LFGDKREKLATLQVHQRKLSELVGDLLEKADQIDQHVEREQRKPSKAWQEAFAKTCQECVSLSEAINGISALLKKGDIKASEKALLKSAEIAKHLHQKLAELERGAK